MRRGLLSVPFLACCAALASAQSWQPQQSNTTVSLRGISAVSSDIAWASGTKGTFLRTTDGGKTWTARSMPGAADLDFRNIYGVDERTAYVMSSGAGELSRIYKTTDGGASWIIQHTNLNPKGFLDCMTFWDATHAMVVGDAVDGRFTILTTRDGDTWQKRQGPKANSGEAAFAASGTCIFGRGTREAWFGTGGTGGARVFHTTDGGETWSVAKTPVRSDSANAGIFSVAFSDAMHGIAVGGDYAKTGDATGNAAETDDGGKTWRAAPSPKGYRSAVVYVSALKQWLAVGTDGSDIAATDLGWRALSGGGFNAASFVPGMQAGWAVGAMGRIARFTGSVP